MIQNSVIWYKSRYKIALYRKKIVTLQKKTNKVYKDVLYR